ncbi:MAG: YbjN domain-containing protein [Myxococcota bacterium]
MSDPRAVIGTDSAAIEAFLEEEGHRFSRIADGCWRGRFRTPARIFPFVIHATETVLRAAVVPYMASPSDDTLAAELYDRLLQLNQVLFMAKFSIDDDLDVVLSVTHPVADLQASELRDGLAALLYYADHHHQELHRIVDVVPIEVETPAD